VVRLRGWVGYHVDLEFEPGESFVTLGGGDLAGLTYGAFGNHLVLKPKAPTLHTNLTVFTNKRTYVIDYAVSPGRPDPQVDELVYSLRFSYPLIAGPTVSEAITQHLAASPAPISEHGLLVLRKLPLQPIAVSDDGVHTPAL
jgi:type IV secretory pathway VirB9-like protein